MHYKIEEVVNYEHGGQSANWTNIKIWDCTELESEQLRALVYRLYDEYVKTQVKEEEEWEKQRKKESEVEFNRQLVLPYKLPPG
jgi:hypothetical protein